MKKIFPLLIMVFLLAGCISKNQIAENTNQNNINSTENENSGPQFAEIDLNDLVVQIDIPKSAKSIKLIRGNYVYTLSKIENLNNKEYYVYEKDNFSVDANSHEAAPEDVYLENFAFVPTSDQSAMRAIKLLGNEDLFSGEGVEIKTPQDMQSAQTAINDVNHLNGAKFDAGILGANQSIKETAKKIKVGDIIAISGQHYKHSKIELNREEQPLTHCLSNMDMFYASKLEIKR